MPSDLERAARQFRQQLLDQSADAANQMVQAYGLAYQAIQSGLTALTERIQQAKDAGQAVGLSWLFKERRLQSLQQQAESEIATFAAQAGEQITEQQRSFVAQAQEHAEVLGGLAKGTPPPGVLTTWNRLPTGALQELVGVLSNGSPLKTLLDELPADAGQSVRKVLITGVSTGQGPRQMARQMRESLGGNLNRALTISRTETLRAYRESSRLAYEENDDVVQSWRWLAAYGPRTCASCLAMSGTIHPLSEPMGSHVNCRCVMVPHTRSWGDILGDRSIPDTRPRIESGEEWFQRQSPEVWAQVLGDEGGELYQQGMVSLSDFVKVAHSQEWGTSRTASSVADALERAGRRQMRKAA